MTNTMDFDQWLSYGIEQGWCGAPVCETHDGFPMSQEEYEIMDEDGEPPCMHMIRLYESPEHRDEVEEAHSPSQWRKLNWFSGIDWPSGDE